MIEAAKGGDMRAAELILARTWPPRRGRPVRLGLPVVETAANIAEALTAVVVAMAEGQVTPEEAATVTAVLEARRRALETQELAERVTRLQHGTERK